ncbi:MAG: hypothetical protein ACW98I_00300 [Candidatus Hodarchaeales archaeon]|jgi:hypothetical protein
MNLKIKIGIITFVAILLLNLSNLSSVAVVDEITDPIGEYGSFYLSSNGENSFLLKDYYQAEYKDIEWSLTIVVDSNSSSGLIFSLYHNSQITTVSGEKEFTVEPGQTRTLIYNHGYIYHEVVCSCEASPINFYYSLLDPTENASGNFEFLNTVFEAFPLPETTTSGLAGFSVFLTLLGILPLLVLGFKKKMK